MQIELTPTQWQTVCDGLHAHRESINEIMNSIAEQANAQQKAQQEAAAPVPLRRPNTVLAPTA